MVRLKWTQDSEHCSIVSTVSLLESWILVPADAPPPTKPVPPAPQVCCNGKWSGMLPLPVLRGWCWCHGVLVLVLVASWAGVMVAGAGIQVPCTEDLYLQGTLMQWPHLENFFFTILKKFNTVLTPKILRIIDYFLSKSKKKWGSN